MSLLCRSKKEPRRNFCEKRNSFSPFCRCCCFSPQSLLPLFFCCERATPAKSKCRLKTIVAAIVRKPRNSRGGEVGRVKAAAFWPPSFTKKPFFTQTRFSVFGSLASAHFILSLSHKHTHTHALSVWFPLPLISTLQLSPTLTQMFYYLSITLSKPRARTYAQFYLSLSFSVAKPVLLPLFVNIIHRGLPYLSSTHTRTHLLATHFLFFSLDHKHTQAIWNCNSVPLGKKSVHPSRKRGEQETEGDFYAGGWLLLLLLLLPPILDSFRQKQKSPKCDE